MEYKGRKLWCGEEILDPDYMADIVIWHKLGDKRAYKELFKLKQELNQYEFHSQFFILQYLIKEYIQRNMIDAAEEELDYLNVVMGLKREGIIWESDYRIFNDLRCKVENFKGDKVMYLEFLEFLELNSMGVVLLNGKEMEIVSIEDDILNKLKPIKIVEDGVKCMLGNKKVKLIAL